MGNQNQDPGRQTQRGTGKRTPPQDPKLTPERDDENTVQRRTSDEGIARERSSTPDQRSASQEDRDRPRRTPSEEGERVTDDDSQDESDSNLTGNP